MRRRVFVSSPQLPDPHRETRPLRRAGAESAGGGGPAGLPCAHLQCSPLLHARERPPASCSQQPPRPLGVAVVVLSLNSGISPAQLIFYCFSRFSNPGPRVLNLFSSVGAYSERCFLPEQMPKGFVSSAACCRRAPSHHPSPLSPCQETPALASVQELQQSHEHTGQSIRAGPHGRQGGQVQHPVATGGAPEAAQGGGRCHRSQAGQNPGESIVGRARSAALPLSDCSCFYK